MQDRVEADSGGEGSILPKRREQDAPAEGRLCPRYDRWMHACRYDGGVPCGCGGIEARPPQ